MSVSDVLAAAWNSGDPAQVAAVFAEDGARHQFATEEVRAEGRAAIAEVVGAIMAAIPDCSLEVRRQAQFTGGEVCDWTFRGSVQQELAGIPANGQPVELYGCSSMTTRGAEIVEERVYWDAVHFLVGAGLLPG